MIVHLGGGIFLFIFRQAGLLAAASKPNFIIHHPPQILFLILSILTIALLSQICYNIYKQKERGIYMEMLGEVQKEFRHSDPLNHQRKRNVSNTYRWHYNCAGYALGCFSWYDPIPFDCFDHSVQENTEYAIKCILNDFPNVRQVESLQEVGKDEFAVAFRMSSDCLDFHFFLRHPNEHWFHKQGTYPIHPISAKEVLARSYGDFGKYSGPIVLFARKGV